MSDDEKKKMTNPLGQPTARDALVYASHNCTVIAKGKERNDAGTIAFKCVCGTTYVIGLNEFSKSALRNVPEDKKL